MTILYAKSGVAPLCVLLLTLAACAPAARPDAVDRELAGLDSWTAADSPQLAADDFIAAWNSGERGAVLRLYDPDRRRIIAEAEILNAQMRAWHALEAEIPIQCNPRGAYFKTALVTFEDRGSGAPIQEIVWLHLKNGGWWMYSL